MKPWRIRLLAHVWALRNWNKGNRERAERWWKIVDKYEDEAHKQTKTHAP